MYIVHLYLLPQQVQTRAVAIMCALHIEARIVQGAGAQSCRALLKSDRRGGLLQRGANHRSHLGTPDPPCSPRLSCWRHWLPHLLLQTNPANATDALQCQRCLAVSNMPVAMLKMEYPPLLRVSRSIKESPPAFQCVYVYKYVRNVYATFCDVLIFKGEGKELELELTICNSIHI